MSDEKFQFEYKKPKADKIDNIIYLNNITNKILNCLNEVKDTQIDSFIEFTNEIKEEIENNLFETDNIKVMIAQKNAKYLNKIIHLHKLKKELITEKENFSRLNNEINIKITEEEIKLYLNTYEDLYNKVKDLENENKHLIENIFSEELTEFISNYKLLIKGKKAIDTKIQKEIDEKEKREREIKKAKEEEQKRLEREKREARERKLKQEQEERERKLKQEQEERERKLKQEREARERKLKQEQEERERKLKQEREARERKLKQEREERYNNHIEKIKKFTEKIKLKIKNSEELDFENISDEYNTLLSESENITIKPNDKTKFNRFKDIKKILKHADLINEVNKEKNNIARFNEIIENTDCYLSKNKRNSLKTQYKPIYNKSITLKDYLNEDYKKFIENYKGLKTYRNLDNPDNNPIKDHNNSYIERELTKHKGFFDNINGKSLDKNQRRAVVIDEDNTQIIAGAGTGKTLTLEAKIKYLIEKKGVNPNKILCLSYSRASVEELGLRIKNTLNSTDIGWEQDDEGQININKGIEVRTFHGLGNNILKNHKINKQVTTKLLDKIMDKYLKEEIKQNEEKVEELIEFFGYYFNPVNYAIETLKSKFDKNKKIYEVVDSLEELYIANYLYLHNIQYIYEKEYRIIDKENVKKLKKLIIPDEIKLPESFEYEIIESTAEYLEFIESVKPDPYKPTFYLPEYDIYIDNHHVDKNLNHYTLTGNENRDYKANIENKRKLHKLHNTKQIETYSYFKECEGGFINKLEEILIANNIEIGQKNHTNVYNQILKSDYYTRFKNLIKTFINLFDGNKNPEENLDKYIAHNKTVHKPIIKKRHDTLLTIIKEIYLRYINYKKDYDLIDYNDMINQGIDLVSRYGHKKKYEYILVDEFQDTSKIRYLLLKTIQQDSNAKVIIVGDDWQSIYRFTGCDVKLFTGFKEEEDAEVVSIITTHRNSQELIEMSSNFITKNKEQIPKKLKSASYVKQYTSDDKPIKISYYSNVVEEIILIENCIKQILEESDKKNPEILILGRNRLKTESDYTNKLFSNCVFERKNEKIIYKSKRDLDITYRTVHAAKGLEADAVIMIGLTNRMNGFPNKIPEDIVLDYVIENKEDLNFAEERRLFYVGLTRTRTRCYLLAPYNETSSFITEMERDYKNITVKYEFDEDYKEKIRDSIEEGKEYITTGLKCPKCGHGYIRVSIDHKNFTESGNEKKGVYCTNRHKGCDWGHSYNGIIDDVTDLELMDYCPKPDCDGVLVKRRRKRDKKLFMGCTNHFDNDCNGSMDLKIAERRRGYKNKNPKRKRVKRMRI